jgi:hypothetical protein
LLKETVAQYVSLPFNDYTLDGDRGFEKKYDQQVPCDIEFIQNEERKKIF